MLHRLSAIIIIACAASAAAWGEVTFRFSDGINSAALKTKMEKEASRLLTAINDAQQRGGAINFTGIDIDELAVETIKMNWDNVHFRTEDDEPVEHGLTLKAPDGSARGYEVRNIGMEMIPFDSSYSSGDRREISINFNPSGRIVDFNFTLDPNQYAQLIKEGIEMGDSERRRQILHWVEQFQSAYNQKDIKFMEDVFSDDALIITGVVRFTREKGDLAPTKSARVEYVRQNKKQYLAKLRGIFDREKNKGYLNVNFDNFRVLRHAAKPNYYGVTLRQRWSTPGYSDEGVVFLIWDFADENHPKIHVRTWEADIESSFSLSDFKLP